MTRVGGIGGFNSLSKWGAGSPGSMGPPGIDGEEGQEGLSGSSGKDGQPGPIGATGNIGRVGPQGLDGSDGDDGFPGNPGQQGGQGVAGPQGNPGAIVGQVVVTGPPGYDGTDGDDGFPGPPGPQGIAGTGGGGGGGSTGARYPVQELAPGAGNQSSLTASLGTTPTNGNRLILCSESEGGTNITSITQTNVVWSKLRESIASTSPHVEIWIGVVSAAAGTSIAVAYSGTTYCGWHVSEWSGLTGTIDQSAVITNVSIRYIPLIIPTIQTALVIFMGGESTFGADFDYPLINPNLVQFVSAYNGNVNRYAVAFGFPGTTSVIGKAGNAHGGTFSGVTISIT